MTSPMMVNLQDAGCFLMEQLAFFHDHTMFFLVFIVSMVGYIMVGAASNKINNSFLLHSEGAEIIWTLLPGVVLGFIALPSLKVLYLSDEIMAPILTIKIIGNQWYWTYEYSDFENVEFESYMSKSNGENFRLLEVDNRVVIPLEVSIRAIISSNDVIHSWTIPSLGVKMDANPGRLNQISLESSRVGLFFGQCSEMCGALHSFMPICLEVVDLPTFFDWIKSF